MMLYNYGVQRSKERSPLLEYPPELLHSFITTFFNRQDTYAVQQADSRYLRVKEPLTTHTIVAHLKGSLTLGTYALNKQSDGQWLCFDADTTESWEALKDLDRELDAEGVIPYLERSSRGGHLWLFTVPLTSKALRHFGNALLHKYHLTKMEMFPKQDHLETGVGSLVRLPFGIHRRTGQRYPFITPEGQSLALTLREQLELLASPLLVPQEFITHIRRNGHLTLSNSSDQRACKDKTHLG
jgi:hypothetical protein